MNSTFDTEQEVSIVAALADQVLELRGPNLREFLDILAAKRSGAMMQACSRFPVCDACKGVVQTVHRKCQGKHGPESCCISCVTNCICGTMYAPSARELHEDCHENITRCFCGKAVTFEDELHGNECFRDAVIEVRKNKKWTDEQAAALGSVLAEHEMTANEYGWISTSYKVSCRTTADWLARRFPNCLFGAKCESDLGAVRMRIDLHVIELEFTASDGAQTSTTVGPDEPFCIPNADWATVYKDLTIVVFIHTH